MAAHVVTMNHIPRAVAAMLDDAKAYVMSLATSFQAGAGREFRWQPHPVDGLRLMYRVPGRGARWCWSQYAVRTVPTVGEVPGV